MLIMLIIILNNYSDSYDGRISGINYIEDCADIASSIYGISSFSYDGNKKKCYISKTPQIKPALPAAYSFEYDPNNIMCNKRLFLRSASDISDLSYIENRLYDCYDINNYSYLNYFEKNKQMKLIDDKNISKLNYTPHNFNQIILPTSRNDMRDLIINKDKDGNLYIS